MTPQEHADKVRRKLKQLHQAHDDEACLIANFTQAHKENGKALHALHIALADALNEHGAALNIGGAVATAAAAPKDEPPGD